MSNASESPLQNSPIRFLSNLRFKSLYSKLALLTALLASSVDIVPSANACLRIFEVFLIVQSLVAR